MRVGIGLPNAVPGAPRSLIAEWARRADEGTFSSLGVVDRPRYGAYDPLSTLALAATLTKRIGLVTMVVIGPLRDTKLLAAEAAAIHRVSEGRFTLGLGVGGRASDYEAAGLDSKGRGEKLTGQLADLKEEWGDEGPSLLVGGLSDMTSLRIARYADGYVHGGGPPQTFERSKNKTLTAWDEMGRTGAPLFWAQGYFALGDQTVIEQGRDYMRDYYAFTGPFAERIAEGMLSTPQGIAQFVRGYAEAGCEELVLLPAVADISQLESLQETLADIT